MTFKRFQRNIENFVCEHCGQGVQGNGYTNHCPSCLWSKHVDVNPGDRAADCRDMMEPVGLETKEGKYVIIHQCVKCKKTMKNKQARDDNFDALVELAKNIEKQK